jgi:IS30 family transposase
MRERSTRHCLLVHFEGKDAETVQKSCTKKIKHLPESLKRSMTYDGVKEMTQHKKFTMSTKKVYFT